MAGSGENGNEPLVYIICGEFLVSSSQEGLVCMELVFLRTVRNTPKKFVILLPVHPAFFLHPSCVPEKVGVNKKRR